MIHTEGELQAAEKISASPQALQLRYLQTIAGMANEKSNTILFPFPMDVVGPFLEAIKKRDA